MNYVEPIRNKNDIKKIVDYLMANHYVTAIIFQVGLYSGLRVSDILGLNIKDVENKDNITVRERKTGKIKKFPIKDNLKIILNDYLKYRKTQWSENSEEPLFLGIKHHRYHRSQVYRFITEACQQLGIAGDFGTHTMRKTFGYHHYKQFKDVVLLQKIFNHSSPAITLRYIGITQEQMNESYKAFNYDASNHRDKNLEKKNNTLNTDIQGELDNLLNIYSELNTKLDKILNKLDIKSNVNNTFLL